MRTYSGSSGGRSVESRLYRIPSAFTGRDIDIPSPPTLILSYNAWRVWRKIEFLGLCFDSLRSDSSVSYTHLDVYKRQKGSLCMLYEILPYKIYNKKNYFLFVFNRYVEAVIFNIY